MRITLIALAAGGLMAGCNGGSDSADAASNQTTGAPAAPADAAGAPSESVQAPRRGGPPWTPPPSWAKDPGPRSTAADAGTPLALLTLPQRAAFDAGRDDFIEDEGASDGLGPTMNLDSCGGCHSQPAMGGTSPAVNPQVAFASRMGATNRVPPFISVNGPVREARFVRNADGSPDGGVHALFTIRGRSDAAGCAATQPDFAGELARNNIVFRIPTPVFGAGLIEAIPDREIAQNLAKSADLKRTLGIGGRPNVLLPSNAVTGQPNKNGNDGTFGRFGWKAQNKSLLIFSGEAYNVEMGITNGAFPTERDESDGCQFAMTPNDDATLDAPTAIEAISSIERFTLFMRFLAPPAPSASLPAGSDSINRGRELFTGTGCALCHTPTLRTGNNAVAALRNQNVNLYSDLVLHDMGTGLADGIGQGQASGREFRTAPLWGLGQRLFFLHDGRATELRSAIAAHRSDGSEANDVTQRFFSLPDSQQQDMLNFLRSL